MEIIADSLIGRTSMAILTVEEFNGMKRNKVAAWLPPKPGGQTASRPVAKSAAKPASQPQSTTEDDDIPF